MKKSLLLITLLTFTLGFSQPVTVSTTSHTVPQLVNDVLINSPCVNATNITWRTGTNFGSSNGIGFFQNSNANFPMQSGVVLSTGNALNIPGPNSTMLDDGSAAWTGDASLESTLAAAGIPMTSTNASVLEFDFTPISPNFSFDFVFASEEYGNFQCQYSDAFAFLLTNMNTGVTTNLAVVPNTNDPISVITIRDFLYNSSCPSANESFFGRFNGGSNVASSAINFNGQTKVLSAASVLTPNVPYHIKLVIADRLDYQSDSAIFISSNSFNIGQDVLGPDLTVANNTALCTGTPYQITTGLDPSEYTFVWKNGSTVLTGETGPTLTVTTPGNYSVVYQNTLGSCSAITNSIIIEYSSQISSPNPINIYRCDSGASSYVFNLDNNTPIVKQGLNPATIVTYHASQNEASAGTNELPLQYTAANDTTVYVRIQVPNTGCFVVKSFKLLTAPGPTATQPENQVKCETTFGNGKAIFNLINLKSAILAGQSPSIYSVAYFTSQNDANNNTNPISQGAYLNNITYYNTTNTIIYVRVQNISDPACFSTTSFNLIVSTLPMVDKLENVITCTDYTLPSLINGNYFSAPNGNGTPMFAGDIITETQTIYIFNQPNGPNTCSASSSFTVTIIDPDSLAPGDVTRCNFYQLPALTNGNYYTQPGGNGTIIPSGTFINVNKTVYFYFMTTTIPACVVDKSFEVTIYPSINLGTLPDIFECTSYTLPVLTNGKYYPAVNGTGTEIPAGTVITTTQTIFVFATTTGVHPCPSQINFKVTIGITAPQDINQCNGYTLPSLPTGKYYTGPNGTGSVIAVGTLIDTNSTIYIYQPTTSGQNSCTENLSFTLTFSQPAIDSLPNVSVCETYTLPNIINGEYFTATNGGGTLLQPGAIITSTQTVYIFKRLNPTCANESSFLVNVIGLPLINSRSDIDICDQYVLTPLSVGKYYTGPNGTGNIIPSGTAITTSQLIYIYAISNTTPACSAQNSFQINIFSTTAEAPSSVTACDSYILPQLSSEGNNYYTATGGPDGTGSIIAPGTAITTTQIIYVFKETIIRTAFSCTNENTFTVTINNTPIIAPVADINACNSSELQPLTVGNYYTGSNGTGNMLPAGTLITSPQTIYVYGDTNTTPNCKAEKSFYVNVFNVDELPSVTICESYTLPTLTIGKYYTATNGTGTQLYAGNVISVSQTIYIFLESSFLPRCSDQTSFTVTIVDTPIANPVPLALRTVCDEDGTNDGIYQFTLAAFNASVLGSQSGNEFTVSYYATLANAQSQTNAMTTSTLSTVYVRVSNTLTANCYDVKAINIIVNKLPQPTAKDGYICIDNETGALLNSYTIYSGLSGSTHTFVWTNETGLIVSNYTAYTATTPGVYTLVAIKTATGCASAPFEVTVGQSEPAVISYVVEDDFATNQRIVVTATGFGGDYEYKLDGGEFQDSNIFENVLSGIHTITVRDKNGCGITTLEALVVNYPKFFTPNGDGYNDTWNITDLKTNQDAKITIYDRYGKLLIEIRPAGQGWDGTYNGRMMLSDDYWFSVSYTDEKDNSREFRAHFAMKR
ncbi:choice-of-anchor L domain-containing protein [Flavobacterium sp.]